MNLDRESGEHVWKYTWPVVAVILGIALSVTALRIRELERSLAAASAAIRNLEVRRTSLPVAVAARPSAAQVACPEPIVCDEPVMEPDVQASQSAAPRGSSAEEREARVEADLTRRMARAFGDGELEEDEQAQVVELLLEIRRLRALQKGSGLAATTPPEQRDAFLNAQYELEALTGMGMGELIASLDGRDTRPKALEDGAVRKRFADEAARVLGVAEPGSVETLQDGEWSSKPP